MTKKMDIPDPLEAFPPLERVTPELRQNMQIALLVDDYARLQRATLTKRMEKYGATYTQWYALTQIGRKDGMTQTEIGELLDITKGACTTLIDRLIKGEWLERRQSMTDRRHQLIFLTPKGKGLLDIEIDFLSDTYVGIFESLTQNERGILLKTLLAAVDEWSSVLAREQ